ncbi:hypothetical protein ACFVJ5_29810 [Nocardia sp. NPDC127606]|uniref:hypothetical protein n=1 Tax=Nocardia sp. NPDC127606 TaxID=3345406 RepID=UPI00362C3E26
MNEFLCGGPSRSGPTDEKLHFLRSKLPRPVWQSVATFLHGLAPIEPGSFDEERGQVVRDIQHFSTGAMEELARIMESAFDLDLGLRIANAQCGSQIEWIATVRTSTGTYRNDRTTWSGERRTWTLPPHVELVETCHLFEDIYGALEIALAGSSKGRRVRIHLARPYYVPFVDDDGPDDPDPDHYWVVDIFDAPVPDRFTETGSTREL